MGLEGKDIKQVVMALSEILKEKRKGNMTGWQWIEQEVFLVRLHPFLQSILMSGQIGPIRDSDHYNF